MKSPNLGKYYRFRKMIIFDIYNMYVKYKNFRTKKSNRLSHKDMLY